MANSNKKQSSSFISSAFGVAKKLSETGLNVINHVAPGTVSKITQSTQQENVILGTAQEKSTFEKKKYENPQQMLREHLPTVTGKLLGKHYKKINNVASFISPDLNNKLSDFIFDKLNDFVSESTSVDALLKEVGATSLAELAKDPARSQRISVALANQNKIIATLQGVLTGALGGMGAMIDVPTSLALALRSVYHTGRAYGFELNHQDQAIVEYIFKEIDLGTVAEKQALLAAIRTFIGVVKTHNVSQLQQLLGSGNDIEVLKRWIANEDGSFKLTWMNNLPQFSLLSRMTPLASMGISAVYSWKLVDDATDKAQIVFAGAREYLLAHPEEKIDAMEAYEKSIQSVSKAAPLLLKDVPVEKVEVKVVSDELTQTSPSKGNIENEETAPVEKSLSQSTTNTTVKAKPKPTPVVAQEKKAEGRTAKTEIDKPKTVRVRRTKQQPVQDDLNLNQSVEVSKTNANTKSVTKKRTPTKPKTSTASLEKTSEKTLEINNTQVD